ncbi:MAG: 16S rRNA (cytidine(1402)-2'-O)-methyltransferase [Candidatus Kapabacteria bacterium]|nr:16S rRNA (cytidine(1402)-2'-O)-methyltransferase [Candidatus Kapabacteria bacterium]
MENKLKAGLYLVPTPIGNLEDITLRALRVLKECDLIACEDTRHSGMMLKKYQIEKKLISYHDYNEADKSHYIAELIQSGKIVALISDAGSPCISDPGFKIVNLCNHFNLLIVPLPGATAFVPALTVSGFAIHNFTFLGFPPQKKGRQTFIKNMLERQETVIVYESSHRILKFVNELQEFGLGERRICLAREISKVFESFKIGNATEVLNYLKKAENQKGEFVLVIEEKK